MAMRVGMPNLGHTMESGKVVAWLKPVGAHVDRGDLIAVVESDKVSMEVEAPFAGTILRHAIDLQVDIPVGTTIAFIGEAGETIDEREAPPESDDAPTTSPSVAAVRAPPASADASARRIFASPLARSTAERLGVDLRGITATGPDDLITRADVERAALADTGPGIRTVALTPARRRIAERMAQAWREVPMVPLTRHVDVTTCDDARREYGPASWTAILARALAVTLPRHRRLNAWFGGDAIREVASIDIAIAVALPDALAVPVLRTAQGKKLKAIHAEITTLAAAARNGTLAGDAQADGTFTLSNLGATGIDAFQPIINQPQVAILGTGRVRAAGLRREMTMTLVFDHRALDGETGARFLADLAATLEAPNAIFS